jgi:CO/xanthine dehydrogenase FAD-binding subunit
MDLSTVTDFLPATDAAWRDGDAWLGGGTWLFSVPQPRLRRLLDLHAFGWTPVAEAENGVLLGATCTFAELAGWRPGRTEYAGAARLARQCCHALLGSFKVHNVATVGGNICLALPAGPMTALATALDGVARVRGPGGGPGASIPVGDLVTGDGRTTLRPGELLTHVYLPSHALTGHLAFRQVSLSPLGRSAALVIGRRDIAAGPPGDAVTGPGTTVITVTASTPRPVRLRFPAPPTPAEALAALDAAVPEYLDDVNGGGRWRAAMTRRLVTEVLAEVAG